MWQTTFGQAGCATVKPAQLRFSLWMRHDDDPAGGANLIPRYTLLPSHHFSPFGGRMCMTIKFTVALLLVMLCALGTPASADRTVTFGINLALHSGASDYFYTVQPDVLNGLLLWKDWWNALPASNRTTKWGETLTVDLFVDTFSNYTDVTTNMNSLFNVYRGLVSNTSIDYLFVPVASPWDIQLRNFTYYELGVRNMVGTQSTHPFLCTISPVDSQDEAAQDSTDPSRLFRSLSLPLQPSPTLQRRTTQRPARLAPSLPTFCT